MKTKKKTRPERMQPFTFSIRPAVRQQMAMVGRGMGIDSEGQIYRIAIEEFLSRRRKTVAA